MSACFNMSRCIKGARKPHYERNRIFRRTCICKQPILTKYWNYNNFLQILYSCLRYTDRLLHVFFLLLSVILSEFSEKRRRKY